MLYDRDYRQLTGEEKTTWEQVEATFEESKKLRNGIISAETAIQYYRNIPKAALHFQQLFPNNYLNRDDLRDIHGLTSILEEFKRVIDTKATEREILNFIKSKKAYFIIGSILKGFHYGFGHHSAFAFYEFALPPNYIVDYLLVGRSSGGYEFVFIELENSFGQISTVDGEFGATIRKGLKQIDDWDTWLESNYSSLKLMYDKYLGHSKDLPREFFELDKSRLHFVVVAGRRNDYLKKTYRLRRKLFNTRNILLLHYDNLFDSSNMLLEAGNY